MMQFFIRININFARPAELVAAFRKIISVYLVYLIPKFYIICCKLIAYNKKLKQFKFVPKYILINNKYFCIKQANGKCGRPVVKTDIVQKQQFGKISKKIKFYFITN